jgi:hypothetical protein
LPVKTNPPLLTCKGGFVSANLQINQYLFRVEFLESAKRAIPAPFGGQEWRTSQGFSTKPERVTSIKLVRGD